MSDWHRIVGFSLNYSVILKENDGEIQRAGSIMRYFKYQFYRGDRRSLLALD